ncbi:putative beta-lysine N-acetyltransferase [Salimicrobium halophilum]|uniref:Putative beta-lysine N-acetyltransferase n=1 Tax=Salimicrobium halophilum TaxID=86666 RepID=A0A1G8R5F9_9BACI|nr:putative beta-lysine N-acetyltransferase [Salimicrobium halophilum]SDJ12197.1 putative beta-lysine N-acetyltransferase [Salimicrobium halophilum]
MEHGHNKEEFDKCLEHLHLEPISRRMKAYLLPKETELDSYVDYLIQIGMENDCDKIIFFVTGEETRLMQERFYSYEGRIGGFFDGEDAYVYALFLDEKRNIRSATEKEKRVLQTAFSYATKEEGEAGKSYYIRRAQKADRFGMSQLYKQVFASYPTPMDDPDFILEMMESGVYAMVGEYEGRIVSSCAGDWMPLYNACELTDCATLPEHRGKGLLVSQARRILEACRERRVKTIFSYSRSLSTGMNIINARLGFKYGGRMVRNSNIAGSFENMNIWYRNL